MHRRRHSNEHSPIINRLHNSSRLRPKNKLSPYRIIACSLIPSIVLFYYVISLSVLQNLQKHDVHSTSVVISQGRIQKKKRLEFVHITKTGGSAVESVGAQNGIIWGACHYLNIAEVGCSRPDINYSAINYRSYALTSPWHTPPKHWKYIDITAVQHPYTDADLFTIVRNPYDRIISEYYCPWHGFQAKYRKSRTREVDLDPSDPFNLNGWVRDTILQLGTAREEFQRAYSQNGGKNKFQMKGINEDSETLAQKHYINQAEYIFHDDGNILIKHILHYENLSQEFDALMKEYNMGEIRLPQKEEKGVYADAENSKKRLTYRNLYTDSIRLINEYAKPDFEKLGYVMVEKELDENYSLEAKS